jgi:hypothetical protein
MLHKLEPTLPQQLPRMPQACDMHLSTRPFLSKFKQLAILIVY